MFREILSLIIRSILTVLTAVINLSFWTAAGRPKTLYTTEGEEGERGGGTLFLNLFLCKVSVAAGGHVGPK